MEDVLLDKKERDKITDILRSTKFEDFEIHTHFYNNHGLPRHGVDLNKVKEIYYQFDKIIAIQRRSGNNRFKYCVIYKFSKGTSYYLLFFLDEKPRKLFNAYHSGKNVEKRLIRKYLNV